MCGLAACCLAIIAAGNGAWAQDQDNWRRIGQQTFNTSLDRVTIPIEERGAVKAVRLESKAAMISVVRVSIVYADDSRYTHAKSFTLARGERTKPLDPRNKGQVVTAIEFTLDPAAQPGEARIEVFGLMGARAASEQQVSAVPPPPPKARPKTKAATGVTAAEETTAQPQVAASDDAERRRAEAEARQAVERERAALARAQAEDRARAEERASAEALSKAAREAVSERAPGAGAGAVAVPASPTSIPPPVIAAVPPDAPDAAPLVESHDRRRFRGLSRGLSGSKIARPAEAATPPPEPPSTAMAETAAEQPAAAAAETPAAADKPKDWDLVPVYYGTDRAKADNDKRLDYATSRGRALRLGQALVSVPKVHQVPNVERPWALTIPYINITLYEEREDPRRHFTVKEIKELEKADLLALVRARLGGSQRFKDHALVFVHGFNTSFDGALYRTAQIAYDLEFDGASFAYSWPSKGTIGATDYSYDRESAGQAEPHFRAFLEMVVNESGAKHVSVIAHSMGNQLLLSTLRSLKPALPEGVRLNQVVLAAPDVDRDAFEFLAKEVNGVSRGMTLLAAGNDRALAVSQRFWGGVPRAGDVPATGPVVVENVDTIDITATSSEVFSLNHSGFAEKTKLLADIRQLISTGLRPPDKRVPSLMRIETPKGPYWRYP